MVSFKSFKKYVKNTPKGMLAFGVIGICSLIAAILLVLANSGTPKTDTKPPVANNFGKSELNFKQPADSAASGVVAGSATGAPAQPTPAPASGNKTPNNTPAGNNTSNSANGNAAKPTTPAAPTTPAPPAVPKPDYNLNENWFFATASTGGIYNKCWPTPLTESNEAECGDLTSPYSYPNMRFEGIGISKNGETAQTLSHANAQEKALDKHVEPRLGGGDEAVLLNEAICTQYGLSCGRW